MAGSYNFTIEQGATFQRTLNWKDEAGTPIDLTNYTARMHIKYGSRTGKLARELTTENDGIILDNVQNSITLSIPATQTANFLVDSCVYDLEMVNGERVIRLLEGSIIISPEVTR